MAVEASTSSPREPRVASQFPLPSGRLSKRSPGSPECFNGLVRPTETARGRAWLANFDEEDSPYAGLLLDSLDIVSSDVMRSALRNHLLELTGDATVLIPALPKEDLPAVEGEAKPVAYESFHPGDSMSATPGSEAFVGNVVREFVGEAPEEERGPWIHPESPPDRLRDLRCRRLFLVTDYIGSGQQVIDAAKVFVRNPRIRSWRSFRWLRVVVVAYAASPEGRARIATERSIDELSVVRSASSIFSAPWTDEERDVIVSLCERHVAPRDRWKALGYKRSGGLFVMRGRVPNNVPLVLRQRRADWNPFFDGRRFPDDLAEELQTHEGHRDLMKLTAMVHQERLTRSLASGRLKSPTDRLAVVLALVARRPRSAPDIANDLNVPEREAQAFLDFFDAAGLTNRGKLTTRGWNELRAAKRLPRRITAGLEGDHTPYYPRQLR